jgi:glutaredoxin
MSEIKVYTSESCGPCQMVKAHLKRKDFTYVERNISEDPEALTELENLGWRTTPVTLIGDSTVLGYKPRELDSALSNLS